MPLPTNIQTYIDTFLGNTSPIGAKNFSPEELEKLRGVIQKKQQYNKDRQWNLENMYLDTPSEYRRAPDTHLVEKGKGKYSSEDMSYSERQAQLQKQIDSYKKNPNKVSVSYGDYGVKSGEDAAPVGQNWWSALQQSFNDPAFNLASTLGSFNAYDEGGNYRIEDRYKFNKDQQWFYNNAANKPLNQILGSYWNQPGSLGEVLFNKYRPGVERPVNFNINK